MDEPNIIKNSNFACETALPKSQYIVYASNINKEDICNDDNYTIHHKYRCTTLMEIVNQFKRIKI